MLLKFIRVAFGLILLAATTLIVAGVVQKLCGEKYVDYVIWLAVGAVAIWVAVRDARNGR